MFAQELLSQAERERYARHLLLPEIGIPGQSRLKQARVLIVGAGGLGSPLALYLAAAGVGTLGLVDFDIVELSNLQRQVLHGTSWAGRSKLDSAAARLADLNPAVTVVRHPYAFDPGNARQIAAAYDIVADATDSYAVRYLTNDTCVALGKPCVFGAVFRFEGQVSVFSGDGPCYRCLYPEPPPGNFAPPSSRSGILGVVPGVIGVIQATEILKHILCAGESLCGKLLLYDAMAMSFQVVEIRRDPSCRACGARGSVGASVAGGLASAS